MFWRLLGYSFAYYIVLMMLGAVGKLKQWRILSLVCLYALTCGMGVFLAALFSVCFGHWFPRLVVPVFTLLSLAWCWIGWRHASVGRGFLTRNSGSCDPFLDCCTQKKMEPPTSKHDYYELEEFFASET